MKVTVCQLDDRPKKLVKDWEFLVNHVQKSHSDLVLLPEMPFYPWFATRRDYNADIWEASISTHDRWMRKLSELAPALVLGSRPVNLGGKRHNQGFVWEEGNGYQAAHLKYYLPDEPGYWEASWYERGDGHFSAYQSQKGSIGFSICTDLWFFEKIRGYGSQGAQIIVCPRATPRSSLDKWLAGGRVSSVVSGAYTLSSNKYSPQEDEAELGGQGWVTNPDGDVLGKTTAERKFLTIDIDLNEADRAKKTYPRYVKD